MAKKKEEKSLVSAVDQNLTIPDYLLPEAGRQGQRGRENVQKEDLILPRIKLLQPLSPEVQDEEKNLEAGHLLNSLTQQDYGSSIIFIPVIHSKSRIYFRPRDEEGERIICSALDGLHPATNEQAEICTDCPNQQWDNKAKKASDKAPKCTIFYNFIILVDGEDSPVALSMERTKIKVAKKLISLISCTGNLDMFAKKYKIGITKESNEKGTWYNYDVTPMGFVSAEEFKIAETAYQSLKNLSVKVDRDNENTSDE